MGLDNQKNPRLGIFCIGGDGRNRTAVHKEIEMRSTRNISLH